MTNADSMPTHIIRQIAIVHCARGPENCARCREVYAEKYALLELVASDGAARRVIEVELDGVRAWREFEIARTFESLDEARAYAAEHGVPLVEP